MMHARLVALLLPLTLLGCKSSGSGEDSKYVQIQTSYGRSIYARRSETEKVDASGNITVEDVVTGKRVTLKRDDCAIRAASRSEVTRAKGNRFVYDD